MSAKFDKIADVIDYTPSSAVASGDIVAVGGLVGVALAPIAANELGDLAIKGQFEIDLASGQTFSRGDAIYFDASSDAHATTGTFFGYAVAASGSGVVKGILVQSPPAEES